MACGYALGTFRLDLDQGLLLRGQQPVALGQRAISLLSVLVERPGELITKDALLEAAWPGLAIEESNLAVQISTLRRAFSEQPGGESWIETLPRRGYRFVGPVTRLEAPVHAESTDLPAKILIVDDHELIREALRGVLGGVAPLAEVLEAPDYQRAVQVIAGHPDISLILLDLNLPDRDGFAVLAELRERNPVTSVVVLSAMQDKANVMQALRQGAQGFIPKSSPREVMLNALRLVISGGMYIPPQAISPD